MPVKKRSERDRISKKFYSILRHSDPEPEEGLIRHKDRNKEEHFYDLLEGILTGIELKKEEFEGNTVYKYHFKFESRGHGQQDILQIGEGAMYLRDIFRALIICEEDIGWVSVSPFRRTVDGKTYTNIWTKVNGHDVDWDTDHWVFKKEPEVEVFENELGEKEYQGKKKNLLWWRKVVQHINEEKLAGRVLHDMEEPTGNSEMNGKEQAEALHGEPKSGPKKKQEAPTPEPDPNEVNMENFDDIDDDLPF